MTRIPTLFAFERSLEAMNQRRAALVRDQQQLSTGRSVNAPSDDPVASAQAERIRSQLARLSIEDRMIGFARQMLSNAESTMASAGDALQFVRENLVAAGNGAFGPSDRELIAQQLRGTRDQLLALANQVDGAGGYVFGGQGTTSAPFDVGGAPVVPPNAGEQSTGIGAAFTISQDGRAIFVDPSAPGAPSVFETLDDAIDLLENPASVGTVLTTGLRAAMTGVDSALERLLQFRTRAGEQLRTIDARERLLESGDIEARGRLSELVETDYSATISRFQNNQTALEAAMATYAQVARLTLFDYL